MCSLNNKKYYYGTATTKTRLPRGKVKRKKAKTRLPRSPNVSLATTKRLSLHGDTKTPRKRAQRRRGSLLGLSLHSPHFISSYYCLSGARHRMNNLTKELYQRHNYFYSVRQRRTYFINTFLIYNNISWKRKY